MKIVNYGNIVMSVRKMIPFSPTTIKQVRAIMQYEYRTSLSETVALAIERMYKEIKAKKKKQEMHYNES